MALPVTDVGDYTEAQHADHHSALHSLANTVINVKDPAYGATGLGVADDTASVLLAQADAVATGCPLFWPPGTYRLTSQIVQSARERWVGASREKSILWFDGCDGVQVEDHCWMGTLRIVGDGAGCGYTGISAISGAARMTFFAIEVDGWEVGVNFNSSWISGWYDCYIRGSTIGVQLEASANAHSFFGGEVIGNGIGVEIQGCQVSTWVGVTIEGNTSAGVHSSGDSTKSNVTFSNCYFEGNGTYNIHIEGRRNWVWRIVGNRQSLGTPGVNQIRIEPGAASPEGSLLVAIRDNVFSGTATGTPIYIGANAQRTQIGVNYYFDTEFSPAADDNGIGTVYSPGVKETSAAAAPTSGTYEVGDRVWDTAPAASGAMGWVCTTAGTPGTWKTFGTIAS